MKNKKSFFKGALTGALAVLLIMSMVSCGIKLPGTSKTSKKSSSTSNSEELLDDSTKTKLELLEQLVDESYSGDIDMDDLQEGLYRGYIDGLGDKYSVYYDEDETKALMQSTSGEFGGIGALFSQDKDTKVITFLKVYEGSGAEEAGFKVDDILYKVDGKDISGEDLSEVVSKIRGDEGTTVELTVLRGDDGEEYTATVTRKIVQTDTVYHEMKEDKIGYIQVTEFDDVTTDQYKEALEDLENQGMKGLVVDLRNNPGGNVDTVTDMLDLMLPEGTTLSIKDKQGKESVYESDDEHQFTKPLVVLVNENSASASEIFSGAIQTFGTGEIVGTTTYGKGVVQQIFDLKDGTSVKLTIAEYLIAGQFGINGKGVTPDVEVQYEKDAQNPGTHPLRSAYRVTEKCRRSATMPMWLWYFYNRSSAVVAHATVSRGRRANPVLTY